MPVANAAASGFGDGSYPSEERAKKFLRHYKKSLAILKTDYETLSDYVEANSWLGDHQRKQINEIKTLIRKREEALERNEVPFLKVIGVISCKDLAEVEGKMNALAEGLGVLETYQTGQDPTVIVKKKIRSMQDAIKAIPADPEQFTLENLRSFFPEATEDTPVEIQNEGKTTRLVLCYNDEKAGGGFGIVYRMEASPDTSGVPEYPFLAVKRPAASARYDTEKTMTRFIREFMTRRNLGEHPNLVPLLGGFFYNYFPHAVFPYSEYGSVRTHLIGGKELDRVKFLWETAKGLEHIHRLGAVHSDLKGANIVLSPKKEAWIIDFGLAKSQSEIVTSRSMRRMGTSQWRAPELFESPDADSDEGSDLEDENPRKNSKTDVYAFGILIYEILVLPELLGPYINMDLSRSDLLKKVKRDGLRPAPWPTAPGGQKASWKAAESVAKRCWVGNSEKRPPMPKVRQDLEKLVSV